MSGTAKVMGSSLFSVSKKRLSVNYSSTYLLSAELSHLGIVFFSTRIFNVVFGV